MAFVYFDAWRYEGDSLRRQFLLLIGLCELEHPQNPASDGRNRAPGDPGRGFFMQDQG